MGLRDVPIIEDLWEAQGGRCFHCGNAMLGWRRSPRGNLRGSQDRLSWSREHLHPRSSTGHGLANNVVLAHRSCNARRGSRPPTEGEIMRARAIYAALGKRFAPRQAPSPRRGLATLGDLWPGTAVGA